MGLYRLNDEQYRVLLRVREVAAEAIAPNAVAVDADGRFPQEAIDALGAAGLLGLSVPEALGGMGQGLRTAAAVLDEIAQHCASTAMIYLMHLCGCACYVAAPNRPEGVLRDVVAGKHLSTLAWSEKGSRSHFWAPVSQASASNGTVALNAEKSWVTSAGQANGYVVSTRTAGGSAATDTMLYLVLDGDQGVAVSGPWDGLGMRGNASAPMSLKDCQIGSDRALCATSEGFNTMLGVALPWFQLGNAAVSVGIADAATAATIGHITTKRFEHQDQPLSSLPNLRARVAQMRIETDRARAHLVSVIDAVEREDPKAQLLVLESKAVGAEAAISVTDTGMRTCGGAAFSGESAVGRCFRDSRAAAVMAPTTDVINEFIGRALCGMELF